MAIQEYTIPNISCKHCIHTIEVELLEQPGVKSVEGDNDTKVVRVEYEDPANDLIIRQILAEINYPAS